MAVSPSPTSTKTQKAREPSLCTSWYGRALNHLGEGDRHHRTNSEGLGVELAQPGFSSITSLESLIVDLMKMELDTAPWDELRSTERKEDGVHMI